MTSCDPPIVSRGSALGDRQGDARRGISCGASASACEVGGAIPPIPPDPPSPYSTPAPGWATPSPFSLNGEEEEQGERYEFEQENTVKTRSSQGGSEGGSGEDRGRLRLGVPPVPPPRTPENSSRVRGTDKTRRAAIARYPIRSFRASPRLLAPPRAFLSDSGPLASRVASSPSEAPLFGAHNRASFGCDNPATCESGPSVRSGGVVGDEGVGEKVGDMRADHPLHFRGGPENRTTRSLGFYLEYLA